MSGRVASPLSPIPPDARIRRFAQLAVGLVLYGVSASMLVLAALGLDPWDVLHQGLSRQLGLGIGTWAVILSFVVLALWWPLHQRAGVGTIGNALVVGLVMNVVLGAFDTPHALGSRVALLLGGVVLNGIATGMYIGAGMGPGPRDGLTTGLAARGHSIRVVRTGIEVTVLIAGFALGGTVGIGTLLYALAIGPISHITIPALTVRSRAATPIQSSRAAST